MVDVNKLDLTYQSLYPKFDEVSDIKSYCDQWKGTYGIPVSVATLDQKMARRFQLSHVFDMESIHLASIKDYALAIRSRTFIRENPKVAKILSVDRDHVVPQQIARVFTEWAVSAPAADEGAHWQTTWDAMNQLGPVDIDVNTIVAVVNSGAHAPFMGSLLAYFVAFPTEVNVTRANLLIACEQRMSLDLYWVYRLPDFDPNAKVAKTPYRSVLSVVSAWLYSEPAKRKLRRNMLRLLNAQANVGLDLVHLRRDDAMYTHLEILSFLRGALSRDDAPSVRDIRLPCTVHVDNSFTQVAAQQAYNEPWCAMALDVMRLLQTKRVNYMRRAPQAARPDVQHDQRAFLNMMGVKTANLLLEKLQSPLLVEDVRVRVFGEVQERASNVPPVAPGEPQFTPEMYRLTISGLILKTQNNKGIYHASLRDSGGSQTRPKPRIIKVIQGRDNFEREIACLNALNGQSPFVRMHLACCLNDDERRQINLQISETAPAPALAEAPMTHIPAVQSERQWYYILFEQNIPVREALKQLHSVYMRRNEFEFTSPVLRGDYVRLGLLYLWHVARGVDAMGAVGMVHRDLAFRNVLASGHRGILCDFGLAELRPNGFAVEPLEQRWNGVVPDDRDLGRLDVTLVPPEVLRGAAYTPESDWYQFALLMFVILSGGPLLDDVYHSAYTYSDHRAFFAEVAKLENPLRPELERLQLFHVPDSVIALMERLWAPRPMERRDEALLTLQGRLERAIFMAYGVQSMRDFEEEVIHLFFSTPALMLLSPASATAGRSAAEGYGFVTPTMTASDLGGLRGNTDSPVLGARPPSPRSSSTSNLNDSVRSSTSISERTESDLGSSASSEVREHNYVLEGSGQTPGTAAPTGFPGGYLGGLPTARDPNL